MRAAVVPVLTCLFLTFGIVITYMIAVANKHIQPFVPFISNAGSYPPESCIFSQVFNVAALLIALNCFLRYEQVSQLLTSADGLPMKRSKKLPAINGLCFIIGLLMSAGTSVIGNFQEVRCDLPHGLGGIVLFGLGPFYLFGQTFIGFAIRRRVPKSANSALLYLRLVLSCFSLLFMVGGFTALYFAKLGKAKQKEFNRSQNISVPRPPNTHYVWKTNDFGYIPNLMSTSSEWVLAFNFLLFMLSYAWELRNARLTAPRLIFDATVVGDSASLKLAGVAYSSGKDGITNITNFSDRSPYCARTLVASWLPILFALLFGPYAVYQNSRKHKRQPLQLTILLVSKMVINGLLLVVTFFAAIAVMILYSFDFTFWTIHATALASLSTMIVTTWLLHSCRQHGVITSGTLFLTWLLCVFCGLFNMRYVLFAMLTGADKLTGNGWFWICAQSLYFVLLSAQLILGCFVDKCGDLAKISEKCCPERGVSFLNQISFCWMTRYIITGWRRPLTAADLWYIEQEHNTETIFCRWKRRCKAKISGKVPSITWALLKLHYGTLLWSIGLKVLSDAFQFCGPFLLGALIRFVLDQTLPAWHGIWYSVLLFLAAVSQSLLWHQYSHRMFRLGMNIKSALTSAIFEKMLRLSNDGRNCNPSGQITNLVAVDVTRVQAVAEHLVVALTCPVQMTFSIFFVYKIMGFAAIAAVLVVPIVTIPLFIAALLRQRKLHACLMRQKDERARFMAEICRNIKLIKLLASEQKVMTKVLSTRCKEIGLLKKIAVLNAFTMVVRGMTPLIMTVITIIFYVLIGGEKRLLTPDVAFISIALFDLTRYPLSKLAMLASSSVQAAASIKRLNRYFESNQLDISTANRSTTTLHAAESAAEAKRSPLIDIRGGCFSWHADTQARNQSAILSNIDFCANSGQFTAIVGKVGSGKSSLLKAILGEMQRLDGEIAFFGTISYAAQEPWLQNMTIKENILFDEPFNEHRYNSVIGACALHTDLRAMPDSDLTIVGEDGTSLSGGQRARICLARALYKDADIYLIDDPLAAVDVSVARLLYRRVFGEDGFLKNKTRIVVSNNAKHLKSVDNIFVLKDGKIAEHGTFSQLVHKQGVFAGLMREERRRLTSVEDTESDQISEEAVEIGTVNWIVYGTLVNSIGCGRVVAVLILHILSCVAGVASNFWLADWTDQQEAVAQQRDRGANAQNDKTIRIIVFGVLGLGQALLFGFSMFTLSVGMVSAGERLHETLLQRLMRAPVSFFDSTPSGRILNRIGKDVENFDIQLAEIVRTWIRCAGMLTSSLIVISISTPTFMLTLPLLVPLYAIMSHLYVATSRQLKRMDSASCSQIYSHFQAAFRGCSTIRAFAAQNRFLKQCCQLVDNNLECYYPGTCADRWLGIRLELVGASVVFFAALLAAVSRHSSTAGSVGLSIVYAFNITQTLKWIVHITSSLETNIVAVERIREYSKIAIEAAWSSEADHAPAEDWPARGQIVLKDVSARHNEVLPLALKGIALQVAPGEKLGIVGRTGAGKSTLAMVLCRIIEPESGSICIDGLDICSIGLHELRSRLTIISQESLLMSGSIRSNIDPSAENSDDSIWEALEMTCMKDFVSCLPCGLDQQVRGTGENLSAGQRQLISLARALLMKSRVVILDEATSAVDMNTDSLVQQTIKSSFNDCTVVTIAHRLSTIIDYDRVLVLKKGSIAEIGKPQELLQNKNTEFYNMIVSSKETAILASLDGPKN